MCYLSSVEPLYNFWSTFIELSYNILPTHNFADSCLSSSEGTSLIFAGLNPSGEWIDALPFSGPAYWCLLTELCTNGFSFSSDSSYLLTL